MRRCASTVIVLTLAIIVAVIAVGGCTRPKPTEEPSTQLVTSPTIEAPPGATVVAVEATPTLVPPGEMPADLTLTLAASPTAEVTPTVFPTAEEGTITASPTTAITPTVTPTSQPGAPTATTAPTIPPGTPGASVVHVVQPGENLFRIAMRYNITVEAITAANGIPNPRLIYVGQKLTIPQGSTTPPSSGGRTHVVRPGENLFRIALRYGTTAQAIAAANNLPNIHLIYVGQVLRVP
jgi:LysM repeat protein